MYKFILLFLMACYCNLKADHVAKLEIKSIEWNGHKKTYDPLKKIEITFREWSQNIVLDTIEGEVLMLAFKYEPIYNDTSERPGFKMVMFDSFYRENDVYTPTDWRKGKYEAGMKVTDENGLRRWEGALRYVPDTLVHLTKPVWRKDNYTFKIGSFRAWNARAEVKKNNQAKEIKNLYFQGLTGEKSTLRSGGKYGNEDYYMLIDPVRYQWGGEVWMEITVRLYRQQTDGKYLEILAHTFSSKDKNVFYSNVQHDNAYEVRDAQNKYYMLMLQVLIIPY